MHTHTHTHVNKIELLTLEPGGTKSNSQGASPKPQGKGGSSGML